MQHLFDEIDIFSVENVENVEFVGKCSDTRHPATRVRGDGVRVVAKLLDFVLTF